MKLICPLCRESHSLYNCEKFRALPIESRIDEVRKRRFCFNCLVPGHHNRQCYAGPCNKCHKKHNNLLHIDYLLKPQTIVPIKQIKPPAPQPEPVKKTSAVLTNLNDPVANEEIMLGTAIVWIEDSKGKLHEFRASLDSCSQVNIVTRNLYQRSNIEMLNLDTVVSGVFKATQEPQYCTNIKFSSCSTKFSSKIKCLVASEITDDMPNLPVRRSNFEIPKGIVLADPLFTKTRPVDLLIGAGLFWNLICVGQKHLRKDQPILQKIQLGWIVAGPMQVPSRIRQAVCNLITNQQLHDQVKFWEIKNHKLKGNFPKLDHNDELEQHFLSTTERDEDGRFVVTMPFKNEVSELGESLYATEKRFLSTERNLGKDSELREKYIKFMDDYEKKGHMELIPSDEVNIDEPIYYFPHHAVKKEGSTTTNVRVVFDGSAETTSGLSFNQVQRVGTVVQNDLFSIILRFRQHPIALSANIARMYRQVKNNQKKLDFQRILWRKDPSQTLQHFRLKTVTYGTASAAYLATRALRQVGEENKDEYSLASEVIIRNFYVDDLLAGFSSLEGAQQLKEEITTLLSSYGFELRKWACNESQVFNESGHTPSERIIQAGKDPKTLGLLWKPEDNELNYLVPEPSQQRVTKRSILSSIAQIFDPLGLVGPAIIRA